MPEQAGEDFTALLAEVALLLDGYGPPKGLAADEDPLEPRIITTTDMFDALTARCQFGRVNCML